MIDPNPDASTHKARFAAFEGATQLPEGSTTLDRPRAGPRRACPGGAADSPLPRPFTAFHCKSQAQARFIRRQIEQRLRACKLEVHPGKTKIVYCKDELRPGQHTHESFDFLGFTFRPRCSKNRKGKFFVNFSPAVSGKATQAMRATLRGWRIHRKSDKSLEDLSRMIGPMLRGWINYYGSYYKSALYSVFRWINRRLVRWAQQKYKRHRHQREATHWLRRIARRQPGLFAHWQLGVVP